MSSTRCTTLPGTFMGGPGSMAVTTRLQFFAWLAFPGMDGRWA